MVVIDGETGAVYAVPAINVRTNVRVNIRIRRGTTRATSPSGRICQWDGTPDAWTDLGMAGTKFVTAGWKPSSGLFCLDSEGKVQRYSGTPGTWQEIGAPPGGAADLFGGPDALLAIQVGSGDVYKWDDASTAWKKIGGPGKMFAVGKGGEFKTSVWGLSPDLQGVFQWTSGWINRGGPAAAIYAGERQLFRTDPTSGDVFVYSDNIWTKIGGPGKTFAVDGKGILYGLSPDAAPAALKGVYRWRGTAGDWEMIGGPAGKLFAGGDGLVFVTNPDTGDLMRYASAPYLGGPSSGKVDRIIFTGDQIMQMMPPKQHRSTEGDNYREAWTPKLSAMGFSGTPELGKVLPEWLPVPDPRNPAILEGIVVEHPKVSFEDMPINHYTHDVCFQVVPDSTPDRRYQNLLGIRVFENGSEQEQQTIEVEWECGLGASNDGNPLAGQNRLGIGMQFFAGGYHARRDTIWNWPTTDDWVHVEGNWIWDRGHPPSKTEIHPPRLVAIRRALPACVVSKYSGRLVFATRIDIFASADGGALWNNFSDAPAFVQRVPINDRDYIFDMEHRLSRPSPAAKLRWHEDVHNGDSFDAPVTITDFPVGKPDYAMPYINIQIPWKSKNQPDTRIFARTIYVYWDEGNGIHQSIPVRKVLVDIKGLEVKKTHDIGDGEYRAFVEVGGNWLFANEFMNVNNVLDEGLGDVGGDSFNPINKEFAIYLLPGQRFRVHAGGWEADGVNDVFGKLIDPYASYDESSRVWFDDNLVTDMVGLSGSEDDPIGEVNTFWDSNNNFGLGSHKDMSIGNYVSAAWSAQSTYPMQSFYLVYEIKEGSGSDASPDSPDAGSVKQNEQTRTTSSRLFPTPFDILFGFISRIR
jgi:hypothetical protein